jgi:DNA-binding CsgD family transcriptional regulator
MGRNSFGQELRHYVNKLCGAEYCTVLVFASDMATDTASGSLSDAKLVRHNIDMYIADIWRVDPMIAQAKKLLRKSPVASATVHMPVSAIRRELLPAYQNLGIHDRVMVYGLTSIGAVGISLLRSKEQGAFTSAEAERVARNSDMLMAIAARHSELVRKSDCQRALESVEEIEGALDWAEVGLSQRELQVCARILYGLSKAGVAADLGIGEETVVTYRRRAYQHLGIATKHELLRWYFGLRDRRFGH